jgi:deazaflavin-dependent oxidoreductase (nitroreductase family)
MSMADSRTYLRPSWFYRHAIAAIPLADRGMARLMSMLTGDSVLHVRGRKSGRLRTTLAKTITVHDGRYVVAIRGETQWARNLRAAGEALLREKGATIPIRAVEVVGDERRAVIEAKREWSFETSDVTNASGLYPLLVRLRDRP